MMGFGKGSSHFKMAIFGIYVPSFEIPMKSPCKIQKSTSRKISGLPGKQSQETDLSDFENTIHSVDTVMQKK